MTTQKRIQIGPFELQRPIGRGGMGTVYRGVDLNSGSPAAIKVLARGLSEDENFRLRFEQEIEAMRQLNHPNIVKLLGYGQDEDVFYYAMELVDGCSLEDEIHRRHRFAWDETMRLGIQICSALRCAHDHGIIHRDLKPANLLIYEHDKIKLTDFGIATLFGANKLTEAGNVVGTIAYMAPEQASLQPISARADLYSFGAVLVTLLSGHPPFEGKNLIEILHQQTHHQARRPSQLGIDLPTEFDELIGRLLEREPEKRPKSAFMVQRQMEAILQEETAERSEKYSEVVPLSKEALAEKLAGQLAKKKEAENHANATVVLSVEGEGANPNPTTSTWFQPFVEAKNDSSEQEAGEVSENSVKIETVPESSGTKEGSRSYFHAEEPKHSESEKKKNIFWDSSWGGLLFLLICATGLTYGASHIIRHWSTPPPADKLYERIITAAEDENFLNSPHFERDVDLFLSCYSRDPRSEKILEFQNTIRLNRLEKRLRMNIRNFEQMKRTLAPVERDYLYAIRNITTQPDETILDLEAFMTFYESVRPVATQSPEAREEFDGMNQYLEIARQQLLTLRKIEQKETEARAALIQRAQERQKKLSESDDPSQREEAQNLENAIQRLYPQ